MVVLSKRLQGVADLISSGGCIADIGTDHAYIPIYLMQKKLARSAIAMDVNEGPLERAKEHIVEAGLADKITLRLSNGLEKLAPGEADTMVAAGMGGGLIIRILTEGEKTAFSFRECILQPQSELEKVRKFLLSSGYQIEKEKMVLDDGKYYTMMRVLPPDHSKVKVDECCQSEVHLRYGRYLLETADPLLRAYLEREKTLKTEILEKLEGQQGFHICRRRKELEEELACIGKGLEYYGL